MRRLPGHVRTPPVGYREALLHVFGVLVAAAKGEGEFTDSEIRTALEILLLEGTDTDSHRRLAYPPVE